MEFLILFCLTCSLIYCSPGDLPARLDIANPDLTKLEQEKEYYKDVEYLDYKPKQGYHIELVKDYEYVAFHSQTEKCNRVVVHVTEDEHKFIFLQYTQGFFTVTQLHKKREDSWSVHPVNYGGGNVYRLMFETKLDIARLHDYDGDSFAEGSIVSNVKIQYKPAYYEIVDEVLSAGVQLWKASGEDEDCIFIVIHSVKQYHKYLSLKIATKNSFYHKCMKKGDDSVWNEMSENDYNEEVDKLEIQPEPPRY